MEGVLPHGDETFVGGQGSCQECLTPELAQSVKVRVLLLPIPHPDLIFTLRKLLGF